MDAVDGPQHNAWGRRNALANAARSHILVHAARRTGTGLHRGCRAFPQHICRGDGRGVCLPDHWLAMQMRFGYGGDPAVFKAQCDIAQAAERASAQQFDESKFRDLEDAIYHINAATPDAKLSIGDTELAGLEAAVNNLMKRMHESYRQQVRFVDDASHELRTPIAVIQGYTNMLDRWGKDDETVLNESIAAIKTESDHMKTLVEQLLFLARGDMGQPAIQAGTDCACRYAAGNP